MRSRLAILCALLATLAVAVVVAPAGAAPGDDFDAIAAPLPDASPGTRITITNTGSTTLQRIHAELPEGTEITDCKASRGTVFTPAPHTAVVQGASLGPGQSMTIDVSTKNAIAEGTQIQVYAGENATDGVTKTITYSAPAPKRVYRADLSVRFSLLLQDAPDSTRYTRLLSDGDLVLTGRMVEMRTVVTNAGPDHTVATLFGTTYGVSPLPSGERFEIRYHPVGRLPPGSHRFEATVEGLDPDPDPTNNTRSLTISVVNPSRSRQVRVSSSIRGGGPGAFEGSAAPARRARAAQARVLPVKRVEVALLRLGRGVRAAAPRCRWLRGARARFGSVKPGARRRCDRPVWLRAKGKRRWRYVLRRGLPRGRYVLLSRAVNAAGAEYKFSRRAGNLQRFRVR